MRYFLELCIASVVRALTDLDAEIIVIDNHSSDDSCEMVIQSFPQVKLIQNSENLGFSKANNQAIKLAKGEYVCILNPDTVVAEDTFLTLIDFADTKNNLGIIGCKLIDGAGQFLLESKRNVPIVKTAVQKFLGNSKYYYASHINENSIEKVDILVGAFMLLKRDLYEIVGGFDEDYFMYGEDIDLSYRILKQGFDNYYFGKTTIIHFKGESTLKDKNYARRFFGAMQIFYKKHFRENIFFDALVWLGIRFVYLIKKETKAINQEIKRFTLISNKSNKALAQVLDKEMRLTTDTSMVKEYTEIILDANYLSYKSIIEELSRTNRDKQITYKILPNNANFVIGSHHKSSRGEYIIF